MKKTYQQLTDTLQQITVDQNGQVLKFLNGVMQMQSGSRFQCYNLHHRSGLMIADYMWWHANEREILNWMAEHLPRGIEHQQGMTVDFDTDRDRTMFLLRWA